METVKVGIIRDIYDYRVMESFIIDSNIEDKKIYRYLNDIIKNDYTNGKYTSEVIERWVYDKL